MKKNKKEKNFPNNFPNLTPRRTSLPGDFDRPLPKSPNLPLTAPLTAPLPEILPEEDYGDILDQLLTKGNSNSSDKLLNKLLEEKEREISRLELEKSQLLSEKSQLEKDSSQVQNLEKTILKLNKKLENFKNELKETETDLFQVGEEKDEFSHQLAEEKLNNRKLEKRLEQQINENDWLRTSFNQTKNELLEKTNALVNLKKIERKEKEEWRKIFTEQEQKYEEEKKEREKVFNKQINNLRTFQLTSDISPAIGRGRGLHKKSHSYSLPSSRSASPRGSTYEEKDPLLYELDRANRFNPAVSSPLKNGDIDPMEETTSDFDFSHFDDLLSEVQDFATQNNQQEENNSALLEENRQLKAEKLALEKNYKTLADEKVLSDRILQEFNQKELIWEKEKQEYEKLLFNYTQKEQGWTMEKQNLQETLNEKDYQLSEVKSKKNKAEKVVKETRNELEEKNKQKSDAISSLKEIKGKTQDIINRTQAFIEVLKK